MVGRRTKGAVMVLIGIGIIGFGVIGPFSTYQEVQTHDTTTAQIEQTGIESATELDDGETEVEYYPRISYTYSVDGRAYTNRQIYHPSQVDTEPGELRGKEFDQRGAAEDVVGRFPAGETAPVHYDPDDPTVAYLIDPSTDLLITSGFLGVFGLVLGGIGIGGLLGIVSLED